MPLKARLEPTIVAKRSEADVFISVLETALKRHFDRKDPFALEKFTPRTKTGELILFLRAALHNQDQHADDGDECKQQPYPLPNGYPTFYSPAFRGTFLSSSKLGGSG